MPTAVAFPVPTKDMSQLGALAFLSCCPPISAAQHRESALLVWQSQQI